MERLKDILYDLSDILITVLIVAIIFFVVTWKLNDVMPANQTLLTTTETTSEITTAPLTQTQAETVTSSDAGTPRDIVSSKEDETTSDNLDSHDKPNETSTEEIEDESTTNGEDENANNSSKTFVIPFGATATEISNDLLKLDLIDSQDVFLTRLSERGDEPNLKAGTFDLSDRLSLDEIIDKLTGN